MNKKIKRGIVSLLLFMGIFGVTASANPLKSPIFIGQVLKVEKCDKEGEMRLLVEGFMNGCDVHKSQICVLVNKDTKIQLGCEKKSDKDKVNLEKGDLVSIYLDKKITKSIPPQANAKRIKVTKCRERNEKEAPKKEEQQKQTIKDESEMKKDEKKEDAKDTVNEEKDELEKEKSSEEK